MSGRFRHFAAIDWSGAAGERHKGIAVAICPAGGGPIRNVPHRSVVVGGPLCESGDIFTQEEGGFVCKRPLPALISVILPNLDFF